MSNQYERWVKQFESELGRQLKEKEKDFVCWICEQQKDTAH
ncbi:hypothetical protein ABID56_002315 [Alkalibacillus flavidus]|uniref:Uncharacterized protein n=1 Tax=Alkalibacillus flavidus TaxID=546021 RepID=A0ABV2KXS4_9BACI